MPLPQKPKIKGAKIGYCSICEKYGSLTYDHVPPKGCIAIKPVEIRTLSQEFYGTKTKAKISQNGTKYRTICKECNNDRLGLNYDPELKKFTDEVSLFLKSQIELGIHFPFEQRFEIKIQSVLRAIIGHNLAGFIFNNQAKPPPTKPFPKALRDFFLNESSILDPRVRIYYWLFPVYDQIHVKSCAKTTFGRKDFFIWDLLKFFPLAYWITWDKPNSNIIPHNELTKYISPEPDKIISIPINFSDIPHRHFPETPEDDEIMLFNDNLTAWSKYKKQNKANSAGVKSRAAD